MHHQGVWGEHRISQEGRSKTHSTIAGKTSSLWHPRTPLLATSPPCGYGEARRRTKRIIGLWPHDGRWGGFLQPIRSKFDLKIRTISDAGAKWLLFFLEISIEHVNSSSCCKIRFQHVLQELCKHLRVTVFFFIAPSFQHLQHAVKLLKRKERGIL